MSDSPTSKNVPVNQVKLELDRETAVGRYANMAIIAHTKDEFVLDFALAYPAQSPLITSRVITSPSHAKALLRSLQDNIARYEARHGTIVHAEPPNNQTLKN